MRKKRKLGFYYLTINEDYNVYDTFLNVLDSVEPLDNTNRKFTINKDKFCFLDHIKKFRHGAECHLFFKSAAHNFRPPLIDSETINERENPKFIQEGERIKTHIVTQAISGDLILTVEKSKDSLTINQIVDYLNIYLSRIDTEEPLRFGFEIIVKDDFMTELSNLSRVVSADLIVDKALLGSNSLNYSNRLNSVRREISINVKANVRDTIFDFINDIYSHFNGGNNSIKKIRLLGKSHDNNDVKINTDFIERQEYVNVDYNTDTGEILSNDMFIEMSALFN